MKKILLVIVMLFFPIVVSAEETVKIKCKSSEIKIGDVITCDIKTDTNKAINAISANLKLSSNLELVEITKNKIFEGDAEGGDIDLYLGYDLIIPVDIVEIKIKLLNDNNDVAYVTVKNIVYTDNKFQDAPGKEASLKLNVIKQPVITTTKTTTTTVPTTTVPVITTTQKTTSRIPTTTRKTTTKKMSFSELPNIEFTTESKKEETTTTTTRKYTTRTEVVRTTTKVKNKDFLDINISDNFLIYLILLLLSLITCLVIIFYVKKQKQ